MEELKSYFLYSGLILSLLSVSLKIALVLTILPSLRARALLVGGYFLLFLLIQAVVKTSKEVIATLLERGYLFHYLIALGLIFWFLYLFTRRSISSASLFVLALPCPVCLASMGLSSFIFEGLGLSFKGYLLLPFSFVLLVVLLYITLKGLFTLLYKGPIEEVISLLLFLSALYLLGSFYFPWKIEELKGTNLGAGHMLLGKDYLLVIIFGLFFLLFGFFRGRENHGGRALTLRLRR